MKNRIYLILFLTIIIPLLIFTPYALALPRNTYLVNFIGKNSLEDDIGFSNFPGDEVSYPATYKSLSILNFYGETQRFIDTNTLEDNLKEEIENSIDDADFQINSLFYLLNSLSSLGYEIPDTLKTEIGTYLNSTEQSTGGFSFSKDSTKASLVATYMAISSYQMIDSMVPNSTIHKAWIISCYNDDGGYGDTKASSSTLLSTFYALMTFNLEYSISDLQNYNSTTYNYINKLYTANGGYRMTTFDSTGLLSSTYYCLKSLSLIKNNGISNKQKTISWILDHQNINDGGFSDVDEALNLGESSVASSYFAFESLNILNALSSLNEEIGGVTFNWFILLIIFIVIGVIMGLGYYIYQKRKI